MTTDITALAQSLKNAASKALIEEGLTWFSEEQLSHEDGIAIHKADAEFIALANPANVLALVEALEKSEKTSEARREAIDVTHKRAARERDRANAAEEALEKAQAAERRWHRVASRIHEQACESDVKIDELDAIRAAAEKLVRCKGRYHSEKNYRALAALFGVKTPDLPPLEHENVHYADAAEMEIAALRQRIAELESRTVTIEPFRAFVTDADLAALHRFAECCDDPESGGHDLEKEQVRRLESIGALQRSGRISYITGFGDFLISITAGIKWEAE
ncbi:ead/Ea22-like family protein [Klebsiella pneumoniae]